MRADVQNAVERGQSIVKFLEKPEAIIFSNAANLTFTLRHLETLLDAAQSPEKGLRDDMAGKALIGMLASYGPTQVKEPERVPTAEIIAECAYKIADAMLEARNK